MKKLIPGQLVQIKTTGLLYSPDGFAMGSPSHDDGHIVLYERIDLDTFPSFSDFYGRKTRVKENEIATIHKIIGRPWRICKDPEWFYYDVYEILIHGLLVSVFRQNLKTVKLAESPSQFP